MAINRRQKRKKKQEKIRKQRRLKQERIKQHEKAEMLYYEAIDAYEQGNYRSALNMALRVAKVDIHDEAARDLAIHCAVKAGELQSIVSHLYNCYCQNVEMSREEYMVLTGLLYDNREYESALGLIAALTENKFSWIKPLTKVQLKELERIREDAQVLLDFNQEQFLRDISRKIKDPSDTRTIHDKLKQASTPIRDSADAEQQPVVTEEPAVEPQISYELNTKPILDAIGYIKSSSISSLELTLQAYQVSFRSSYDQLMCLPTLHNIQSLWYQEETAKKVLKTFRGSAILADEVGLGKTIEACLCLKEYIMRGLVKTALILTPSNLVNQWQSELLEKFQLSFVSSNDPLFRENNEAFWKSPFILASIHTAKSKRHFDMVSARSYDMVIVDEAHHLKNHRTLNWKLVDAIPRTFLLLLTATPVQNNLEELFNLVTLLRPGHLKSRKAFKNEFVTRGNPTDPQNREKLRQLLKEVMIRNTRSVTQLRLPPRFATTTKVAPSENEQKFYQLISEFLIFESRAETSRLTRMNSQKLLEAAGSSHFAAQRMLQNLKDTIANCLQNDIADILSLGNEIHISSKVRNLLDLINASSDQKIIFVNYIATLDYLCTILAEQKIPFVNYYGSLTKEQKQKAIDDFRSGCPVMLATGSGGEGHNLQFCHTMINYDLPWNPMEIEQRIGRIHRIGQTNEVQVYNFCSTGSIEDHILDVLDRKINMFELVVGEIDMILGRMKSEQEFSEMVYEIWIKNPEADKRKQAFNKLSTRLMNARKAHLKSKELDDKLFQEDFVL